ncbi:MAG TPA: DMT family transporter [Actinomycetota bacterium]
MPVRHAALLAMGVVAVSFSAIFIRLAHAPAVSIAFYRNGFAAALVVPLAVARRRPELRALTGRQGLILTASGGLLAVHFATWIASLSYTTIAASVVLVTASPILVAVASSVLFGERVARRAIVGILVGLAGAAIVSGGDLIVVSGRAAGGDLLAVAGAVAAAGYFVAGRRLRQDLSLLTYVATVYATCALLLWPAAVLSGARLTGFPAKTWGLFVLMALVPQMLGHTVFNYLLKDVSATVVAISVMGEPIGSTLLALAFFGETPPWTAVLGGLLLLAGIYVAVTAEGRARRRQPVTPLE